MTDQPASLAEALAAVQAELPTVPKTKTAKVKGTIKAGPQQGEKFEYEYKYADLADVSAAVMPLMGRNGLAFTCQPGEREDGRLGVAYQLLHASGQHIDGWFPLKPDLKMQDIGGSITYIRRYALGSLIGVATEEDTDAQHLDGPAAEKQPRGRPPLRAAGNLPRNRDGSTSRSQVTDQELADTGQMTDAQLRAHNKLEREVKAPEPGRTERLTVVPDDDPFYDPREPIRTPQAAPDKAKAIIMHFGRLGVTDRDERLAFTSAIIGRAVDSTNDLTASEGIEVGAFLSKCKDRKALADGAVRGHV